MPGADPRLPDAYGQALADVGAATLTALHAFEATLRRLHPPLIERLRERLEPLEERLTTTLARFRATSVPPDLAAFHEHLARGAGAAQEAVQLFRAPAAAAELAARMLSAMGLHCTAQEELYPLRHALPPLGRYFVEPPFHADLAGLDPELPDGTSVGIHRAGGDPKAGGRGGFALYVPERYDGSEAWPLVVALHGGYGHGRDFLWTWLREARGRRFLLLAPTSRGSSWALHAAALETRALRSMVNHVCEHWRVDPARILLTGLSDGATFTLLAGLAEESPFTALAPVSGVLHPTNFANGNLQRARGRRILLTHGALDWMFPVSIARAARDALAEAGAELIYDELEDLSHTYPREQNDRILAWLDPSLALPEASAP